MQENAALFNFLQSNGIQSMQQLREKVVDMNSHYYDLRGKIVGTERWIAPSPSAVQCGRSTTGTGVTSKTGTVRAAPQRGTGSLWSRVSEGTESRRRGPYAQGMGAGSRPADHRKRGKYFADESYTGRIEGRRTAPQGSLQHGTGRGRVHRPGRRSHSL